MDMDSDIVTVDEENSKCVLAGGSSLKCPVAHTQFSDTAIAATKLTGVHMYIFLKKIWWLSLFTALTLIVREAGLAWMEAALLGNGHCVGVHSYGYMQCYSSDICKDVQYVWYTSV